MLVLFYAGIVKNIVTSFLRLSMGFPGGSDGKEDPLGKEMSTHSSILAWGNSRDRGIWWATVHGVAKSQTRLGN